jgi:hypothetical protein
MAQPNVTVSMRGQMLVWATHLLRSVSLGTGLEIVRDNVCCYTFVVCHE